MHGNKPVFGMSARNWADIEGASAILLIATTARRATNTVGEKGIFGNSKTSKLAKAGRKHEYYWDTFETLSLVTFAIVLLKSNQETFEGVKNTLRLSSTDSTNLF